MAWAGYFEFNGNEIINASRVEAYAEGMRLGWFRSVYRNTDLRLVLAESAYSNPVSDDAPWYDSHNPVSGDFLGVYPVSVEGIENSSASAQTLEAIGDGGVITAARRGTKTVVFSVILVAVSEAGADYGLQWLKEALDDAGCSTDPTCTGFDLTFFASEPHIGAWSDYCRTRATAPATSTASLAFYQRTLHKTRMTVGPTVTSKFKTSDYGAVWPVTFTIGAGSPYLFSPEVDLITNFMATPNVNPYPGGVTPSGGLAVQTTTPYTEPTCTPASFVPVYDPLAPAVTPPPQPPGIVWGGTTPPATWERRRFVIPPQYVPGWLGVVPVFNINAANDEVRNVRIRIYEDPDATGNMDPDNACDWCADYLVQYVPDSSVLVIDGADQSVYVESSGGVRRRGDALVSDTSGAPFVWPTLSCAIPYVVTIDLPTTETEPIISMALVGRAA